MGLYDCGMENLNWNWRCVWQAANPTASLHVSIMWMEPVLPVRVNRTLLSVRRRASMDTRHPIRRTNTLVQTFKMIYFPPSSFCHASACFYLWYYCFLCLPLQVKPHTASHPNKTRSWLSCTRTDLWRQHSLYMQIFCCTRRVRLPRLRCHDKYNSETVH